jgi:regulatory protein
LARHARRGGDGTEPSAYQRALGLLVRRERSRAELGRKLRAHGVDDDEAETALATLARQDFQNDARFAQAWARTRAAAGYGPIRIRAELAQHALTRELIAEALEACETDWDALARTQARRRYRPAALVDPAQRRKAMEWLLRRGFDTRCAAQAVGGACDGDRED